MTTDTNNVQQPSQDDLDRSLGDTILWMEIRQFLCWEGREDRYQLDRIWPEGTVPRQQEVAELRQRARRLHALIQSLLERLDARGINISSAVTLAVTLGVELPDRLREKA